MHDYIVLVAVNIIYGNIGVDGKIENTNAQITI